MRTRMWLAVLSGALTAALPSMARAQSSGAGSASSAPAEDEDDDPSAGTARPAASDKLTNHLLLHGKVGGAFPGGSIAGDQPFSELAGSGLTFGGGLGLGLSRYLALDVSATYGLLSSQEGCTTCSTRSFDVGFGFTYHLVQGIAFDPWMSFGAGYRRATFGGEVTLSSGDKLKDSTFTGLDVARIAVGGDFFPLPWTGIGPYLELAVGTTISRPTEALTAGVYTVFHLGMRVELDLMGRRSSTPATPSARTARGQSAAAEREQTWAPSGASLAGGQRGTGAPVERSLPWGSF